jgi:aspartate racemase
MEYVVVGSAHAAFATAASIVVQSTDPTRSLHRWESLMPEQVAGLVTDLLKQGKSYRDLFDQVIVPLQPKGTKPPFFCIHGGPGRAIFFNLARHLGSDQPFYGVQSVGLDGKAQPLTSFEDMAAYYIKEMRAIQPSGPYMVGGFCNGGALAIEVAQQLQAAGEKVALVAMLDAHASWALASTDEASPYGVRTRLKEHWNNLRTMPAKDRRKYFALRVEHVNWIIRRRFWEVGNRYYKFRKRPLPKFLWDIDAINNRAFFDYKVKPYAGKLTLIVTDQHAARFADNSLGWAKIPTEGLDIRVVPGLHDYILNEPHVRPYVKALKEAVTEALESVEVA